MPLRCLLPLGLALLSAAPASAETFADHGVTADVAADHVTLANGLVSRTWSRASFVSTIVDHRGEDRTWSKDQPDFTLGIAGQPVSAKDFTVDAVKVSPLPRGGLRVVFTLSATAPLLTVERTVEAYPGVAGFRTQSVVSAPVPLPLSSATMDEAAVGAKVAPATHGFRAGDDWREEDWAPSMSLGDGHGGDWRDTRTADAGQAIEAPGEWVTVADGDRALFEVLERNDLPSSRAEYDGAIAATRVDYTRDIISFGPLEEEGHAENPRSEEAGRVRTIPAEGLTLPAAFLGLASGDGDEGWQFHKYLVDHRIDPFPRDVVFNTDGTDGNVISTGAKDDVDLKTVRQIAPTARALGADVFTLDDGWQAASGDWQPDSPDHREPRGKFPARFPDATFAAVREAIAPMKLGLWMSPTSFNGASEVFKAHPEWACTPLGTALGAASAQDQDGTVQGSDEAGIGIWSTKYFPFLEERLRDAIVNWHVRYFKFDFIMWADCAGANDLEQMHDEFVALIDRLRADHPDVAFAIDETNDYRLFPFDSALRGPTWFTNGGPSVSRVLHNTWVLSPWIPAMSLGQKTLTGAQRKDTPVSTGIAATLLNEQMFTDDLRTMPADVVTQARPWFDWGKAHREEFLSGVTYPLLEDPAKNGWTALENWNPETGRGALLAFRQDDERDSATIALKGIADGRYELRSAPGDELVGVVSGRELRDGIPVAMAKRGSRVLTITRR